MNEAKERRYYFSNNISETNFVLQLDHQYIPGISEISLNQVIKTFLESKTFHYFWAIYESHFLPSPFSLLTED
jgi:hypothetical protein